MDLYPKFVNKNFVKENETLPLYFIAIESVTNKYMHKLIAKMHYNDNKKKHLDTSNTFLNLK